MLLLLQPHLKPAPFPVCNSFECRLIWYVWRKYFFAFETRLVRLLDAFEKVPFFIFKKIFSGKGVDFLKNGTVLHCSCVIRCKSMSFQWRLYILKLRLVLVIVVPSGVALPAPARHRQIPFAAESSCFSLLEPPFQGSLLRFLSRAVHHRRCSYVGRKHNTYTFANFISKINSNIFKRL